MTCERASDNPHATTTYFKQRIRFGTDEPFYKNPSLSINRCVVPLTVFC